MSHFNLCYLDANTIIVTIKDPKGNDIYTEMVNGLRDRGYYTNNLETKQQVRQRQ